MTATTNLRALDRAAPPAAAERTALVLRILAATAFTVLLMAPALGLVLRGGFGDPDDAMRLVEVRAWLDGQGWFDLTAHRLDPPLGASMHWSRLVDLPMAMLIMIFQRITDQASATRFAALGVPALYLVALYAGMARLATILLGRAAQVPALFGTFASAVVLVQFQPGRIGHHAPATVALVFALAAVLTSFDAARARQAAMAGVLIALSLAMSLETLPLLAMLGAGLFGAWIWRGASMARALAWFGGGLGLALPVLFIATVGPDHWFAPTCDALGAPYAGAGVIAAAGALALARFPALRTRGIRFLAAAGIGTLVLLYVALAYPSCLRGPFAGVDPLVREFWLDKVVESKPLLAFMRTYPMTGVMVVLPVALGLLGAIIAIVRETGLARPRFALIAALTAAGLALGFWQVRVFASVTPIALCGGLYVALSLVGGRQRARIPGERILLRKRSAAGEWDHAKHGGGGCCPLFNESDSSAPAPSTTPRAVPLPRASRKGGPIPPGSISLPRDHREGRFQSMPLMAGVLASLAVLPFTSTLWALVLPSDPVAQGQKAACLTPEAFAPLAALPPGTVVAPIDSGSHLLMSTGLGVFAAPYHRNNDGNLFVIEVLRATPDRAASLLASRHVTYVMTCPGMDGREGLSADLAAGRVPPFLTRLPLAGTPYRVFAVRPSGG